MILKWGNSKQEKFLIEMGKLKTGKISNYLISKESYVTFNSYTCLMNSFKFIHCFLSKQSKRSLSFTSNSLFKRIGMQMAIHSQLAKVRPSSVKSWRTQVSIVRPSPKNRVKF